MSGKQSTYAAVQFSPATSKRAIVTAAERATLPEQMLASLKEKLFRQIDMRYGAGMNA